MSKKFTRKKLRLRAKAKRRRWQLKFNPSVKGVKSTPEKENLEVIRSLEAKVKEAAQSAS